MKPLVLTESLRTAAKRCVWFEPPEVSVADPAKLAAYILTYGGMADVSALREQYNEEDILAVLDAAPAGIYTITVTATDVSQQSPRGAARPNVIGNPVPSRQTIDNWIDINAFSAAAAGTFQQKVQVAVMAAIAGCGLCHYKACRPDDKSPVPKTANLT